MYHPRPCQVLLNPLGFIGDVLREFRANQGMLLAGSVAYYTLLSLIPMLALLLVLASQVAEPELVLRTARDYLAMLAPGQAAALAEQIEPFLYNWQLIGGIGLLVLLFFSSMAFTVLEKAISVIFFHRVAIRRRHFLISASLPYLYIMLLAVGFLVVTLVSGALASVNASSLDLFGLRPSRGELSAWLVYALGLIGEVLLLSSLYLVMPVGRLALRHALIGGLVATLLWEVTRRALVWYFTSLSLVNLIYGSLATAVVILLSLDAAALILLLGAQVIATYERLGMPPDEHPRGLHT